MKKLVLLGAIVAMVVVAAAPALAQVSQGFSERRDTSGSATPKVEVSNKGNNVNLCAQLQQAVNTGQVLNEQGVVQYVSKADDIDFTGSELGLTPSETAECTQQISQAAAAKGEAKAGKAEAKAGEAKAGGAEAKALPKTGGVAGMASLLGLGAGALLVAGGLLARKLTR